MKYAVQSGDTLNLISKKFNVDEDELKFVNNIDENTLFKGIIIEIPEKRYFFPSGYSYIVQPGDTIFYISLKLKIPPYQILRHNTAVNPEKLFSGIILDIPVTKM